MVKSRGVLSHQIFQIIFQNDNTYFLKFPKKFIFQINFEENYMYIYLYIYFSILILFLIN